MKRERARERERRECGSCKDARARASRNKTRIGPNGSRDTRTRRSLSAATKSPEFGVGRRHRIVSLLCDFRIALRPSLSAALALSGLPVFLSLFLSFTSQRQRCLWSCMLLVLLLLLRSFSLPLSPSSSLFSPVPLVCIFLSDFERTEEYVT